MAENAETLGEFQIKLESVGGDKIASDLNRVKEGLRQITEAAQQAKQEGETLKSALAFNSRELVPGASLLEPQATLATQATPPPATSATKNAAFTLPPPPLDESAKTPSVDKANEAEEEKKRRELKSPSANLPGESSENKTNSLLRSLLNVVSNWSKASTDSKAKVGKVAQGTAAEGDDLLSKGLASLSSKFGDLSSGLAKLVDGKLSVATLAQGAKMWWESEQEGERNGRSLAYELEKVGRNAAKASIDPKELERITKAFIHQNFVIGEDGNVDSAKSEESARASALSTMSKLNSDMAMMKNRGQIPQWMHALWMQGIDTSNLEGKQGSDLVVELTDLYSRAKHNLEEDQWQTLMSESGDGLKDIIGIALDLNRQGGYKTTIGGKEGTLDSNNAKLYFANSAFNESVVSTGEAVGNWAPRAVNNQESARLDYQDAYVKDAAISAIKADRALGQALNRVNAWWEHVKSDLSHTVTFGDDRLGLGRSEQDYEELKKSTDEAIGNGNKNIQPLYDIQNFLPKPPSPETIQPPPKPPTPPNPFSSGYLMFSKLGTLPDSQNNPRIHIDKVDILVDGAGNPEEVAQCVARVLKDEISVASDRALAQSLG